MMANDVVIGIDTSNYTTSVAVLTLDGELVANIKRPLPVKHGERGLRQSDAVFAHIKNMPGAMEEAREALGGRQPLAVGVSERPRNKDGSYMPCFLSGVSIAEGIGASLGVPVYKFSHQCGHIMAALYSAGRDIPERFFAFHISGGTTELVVAEKRDMGFECRTVGGTKDLNAGQIIDRIGVYMGMPFPAGKYMEEAALRNTACVPKKKPPTDGAYANLSGLENMAVALYEQTKDEALVAAFVFDYVGRAVEMMCDFARETEGDLPFVFAGGVMSNSILKDRLAKRLDASFAEPLLSADNAVGIAILAKNAYKCEKGIKD